MLQSNAPFTPLFIDGKQVSASDGGTFDVVHVTTRKVVGTSASASIADCTTAVDAAAEAFKTWGQTTPYHRRDILLKAADLVSTDEWRKKILETPMQETGCSLGWAMGGYVAAVPLLRTVASYANDLVGKSFMSHSVPGMQCVMEQRPMGVIFGIAPWNAPFTLTLRAIAIPLLCGNTVVLKSSEFSPRTQSLAIELFHAAGIPAGVLNYISMAREKSPELTAQIIAHPAVRKINFTGSDRVGRIIATEAAKHLKPTVLELGGKAPAVVLDDAPLADAANAIVYGAMLHSGQICMSTERVIVQRAAAEPLLEQIRTLCDSLVGNEAKIGPLFTEASAQNVLEMISEAREGGAEVYMGDVARDGAILRPHIIRGVKPGMRLWERESFGPVIAFAVVDTVEEAVELANATTYSLSASLWTKDMYTARKVALLIRAGSDLETFSYIRLGLLKICLGYTNVNGPTFHSEPLISVAGLGGSSGYGHFGIDDFTDKGVIAVHPLGREFPFLQ
ncbi:Aldedh domain-containing protein [Mycena indigotica]|uniref:Aldedh domain-containing protein n=1 Tax=Mycena indigotica TaxID=2126181 RepID=A0A8H6S4N7_9AGAR|nr:Aldedh domain-containing protein [Mycena indigotica]KAF7291971.1 Aldedh domain-containing protein [Mycena indigotica]